MKRIILFRIIFVCVAITILTGAYAQQRTSPDSASLRKGAQNLKILLSLSDQQTTRLVGINKKFLEDLSAVDNAGTEPQKKADQKKKLFKWHDEELKKLFTSQQYQQYKALTDVRRTAAKERAIKEFKKPNKRIE